MKSGDRNANSYQIHTQRSHPRLSVAGCKLLDPVTGPPPPAPYAGYPPDTQLALLTMPVKATALPTKPLNEQQTNVYSLMFKIYLGRTIKTLKS